MEKDISLSVPSRCHLVFEHMADSNAHVSGEYEKAKGRLVRESEAFNEAAEHEGVAAYTSTRPPRANFSVASSALKQAQSHNNRHNDPASSRTTSSIKAESNPSSSNSSAFS